MDGENGRFVEIADGGLQTPHDHPLLVIDTGTFHQSPAEFIDRLAVRHPSQGFRQSLADALTKFRRRRFGVGDNQDLFDPISLFCNQADIKPGDGPCLACPGTGFYQ